MAGQERRESDAGRMDPSVLPPDLVKCKDLGYLILSGGSGKKEVAYRTYCVDPSVLLPDLVTCREFGFLILGDGLGEKGSSRMQDVWTPLCSLLIL